MPNQNSKKVFKSKFLKAFKDFTISFEISTFSIFSIFLIIYLSIVTYCYLLTVFALKFCQKSLKDVHKIGHLQPKFILSS